ncbi:MAG: DUF2115 domain-containing protein [Methanomicrobiales archaeon]|nr:DUF2115 domain-containing protein [Methanomicrobiales archaeon]MDI6875812.1 DUF2115 domain-containing protein [Methanomicrobiales archaeon]
MKCAEICRALRGAAGRRELAEIVCRSVERYTLADLQDLRAALLKDLQHLPPSYRSRLYPRLIEQIFGTHHRVLLLCRGGGLEGIEGPLPHRFTEYCAMVERACRSAATREESDRYLFYYLLAAFNIFVLGLPAHPVGTPFPGGFAVEEQDGEYLCPVREKEGDVETSICPFCPAKQSDVTPGTARRT